MEGERVKLMYVLHDQRWCHIFRFLVTCVVQMMSFTFPGTLNEGQSYSYTLQRFAAFELAHLRICVLFEGDSKMNVTSPVTFKHQLLYYY